MDTLTRLYHPITGTPFQSDETYREVTPCAALAPYIRCFWGSEHPLLARPHEGGIVIPDTCMDIIFTLDYAFMPGRLASSLKTHYAAAAIANSRWMLFSAGSRKRFFLFFLTSLR